MSRLLIVDDSPSVLNVLQMVFESEDYEVVTASDGTEGLAKALEVQPDLVITDSIMPGLDGFGLLRALRAEPATESVPVIMLTAGDPHDPDHIVREPRPNVFVKKSSDFAPLLAEVRDALIRRQ